MAVNAEYPIRMIPSYTVSLVQAQPWFLLKISADDGQNFCVIIRQFLLLLQTI